MDLSQQDALHAPFITNALLTKAQTTMASVNAGLPPFLTQAILYTGARLSQMAGILLGLPQTTVARAIVLMQRFYASPAGGSLTAFSVDDISAVCTLIASKTSETTVRVNDVVYVYAFLKSLPSALIASEEVEKLEYAAERFYMSDGSVDRARDRWFELEMTVLNTVGYEVNVALPHLLCTHYCRMLGLFSDKPEENKDVEKSGLVIRRAWQHLNSGLLNPQMIYLTHQPCAIASAAIYLAARECGVRLPRTEWWEVFDTDREELGFLVVAMLSFEQFADAVAAEWHDRPIPTDVQMLADETDRMMR